MSVMSEADILPIYIGKRETFKQRKVVVIGDRIKYSDLFKSPIPSMKEIENAAMVLAEAEKLLEAKYMELYKE